MNTVRGRLISEVADLLDRAEATLAGCPEVGEITRLAALSDLVDTCADGTARGDAELVRNALVTLATDALLWAEKLDEGAEVRVP